MMKNIKSFLALLLCVILAFSFGGCSSDKVETPENEETTKEKASSENNIPDENLTIDSIQGNDEVVSQEPETPTEITPVDEAEIFVSNKYSLEGTVTNNTDSMKVRITTDGNNLSYVTSMQIDYNQEIEFGMLLIDKTSYLYLPSQKKYTELSEEIITMLGIGDVFDISEFNSVINSDDEPQEKTVTETEINGQSGICTTYLFDTETVKLYSVNNRLIRIEQYDAGAQEITIEVDSITADVPSEVFALDSLEKTDAAEFFFSLMNFGG